ncbi:MAG TPA: hypothetical protein VES88_01620 [Gemmatimonadaceae bacterium]|nr:hypothetical protein [Gemmatimonadaceae bacterium]
MTIRIAIIGAAVLVLSASSATAQGKPPQQVVLSKAVMKSMVASKPKSKIPLTARVGMVRQSRVLATKPAQGAPTSVREIKPASKR